MISSFCARFEPEHGLENFGSSPSRLRGCWTNRTSFANVSRQPTHLTRARHTPLTTYAGISIRYQELEGCCPPLTVSMCIFLLMQVCKARCGSSKLLRNERHDDKEKTWQQVPASICCDRFAPAYSLKGISRRLTSDALHLSDNIAIFLLRRHLEILLEAASVHCEQHTRTAIGSPWSSMSIIPRRG